MIDTALAVWLARALLTFSAATILIRLWANDAMGGALATCGACATYLAVIWFRRHKPCLEYDEPDLWLPPHLREQRPPPPPNPPAKKPEFPRLEEDSPYDIR